MTAVPLVLTEVDEGTERIGVKEFADHVLITTTKQGARKPRTLRIPASQCASGSTRLERYLRTFIGPGMDRRPVSTRLLNAAGASPCTYCLVAPANVVAVEDILLRKGHLPRLDLVRVDNGDTAVHEDYQHIVLPFEWRNSECEWVVPEPPPKTPLAWMAATQSTLGAFFIGLATLGLATVYVGDSEYPDHPYTQDEAKSDVNGRYKGHFDLFAAMGVITDVTRIQAGIPGQRQALVL